MPMRIFRVFHDPFVSLNFEGFDPQVFLNDSQILLFTFFISYEGGHCDPLKRMLRENPDLVSYQNSMAGQEFP